MKSLWNEKDAAKLNNDPLKLRVYTSQLLGKETSLVLHGGGNTSVKATVNDFFGQPQDVLYIKGSGWDLATIKEEGFAAVKLDLLQKMAKLQTLSDTDMVREQRAAMLNPNAPNPSVEAILHAIIPFKFVDHSHTDAVVAITNTPNGQARIKELYGNSVLIIPYVMPGFVLARKVFEMTANLDWKNCAGIVLLNHGLFTFADSAKASYENHIRLVTQAENYIKKQQVSIAAAKTKNEDLLGLAQLRGAVSKVYGSALVALLKNDAPSLGFANLPKVEKIAARGTLTPDHVIRTKPIPVILPVSLQGSKATEAIPSSIHQYAQDYKNYFKRNAKGSLTCLDLAPRWAVWPGQGLVSFGRSIKDAQITSDIIDHTIEAIQRAEAMGGWKTLSEKDIFEMEYWELEQAKLAKGDKPLSLQGKIALVTGAFSGIGRACVEALVAQGAQVSALDINPAIAAQFKSSQVRGFVCDVSNSKAIQLAVDDTVRAFGGLDIVVSNAGIFTPSENIVAMNEATWQKSMALNLTSHQRLMKAAIPYLAHGIDPTVILMGSKNVPAPGPGASAYSVAKAGLTQLARVAALELGSQGIRVNILHPNQVFDTAIWTDEVLQKRAKSYGLSVEEYKTNNILKTEITSKDVANLVCAMASKVFAKTTGAQIPIDGGNDRVI